MGNALEMAGDLSSAGAALAGLILVFIGSISASYEGLPKTTQTVVKSRYQSRAWFSFAGFAAALAATFTALLANFIDSNCAALIACALLILSMGLTVAAAGRAALDIN